MHLSIILNKLLLFTKGRSSSETQGQIVVARESLNGWEKMARRKVKNGEESAWGQSFTRPVPNGRGRYGFWLVQETFVFFCPIRGQQTLESFLCVLTCKVHEGVSCSPCLSWLFAEALHKEVKRFNVRTKSEGKRSEYLRLSHRLMRWTFRRYQHCLKIKANSANPSWTLAWENIRNLAVLPFMLFLGAGKPISNLQNV